MSRLKQGVGLSFLHIFFIILCFVTLIPILYALILSFSGSGGALTSDFVFFPKDFTLENYKAIITNEHFLQWLFNSAVISVCTMALAISCAVLAAYAFSRRRFKGRKGVLYSLLMLNAFPQLLSMFALFRLFRPMGLIDTHIGLIIIYAGSMCIFGIWNLKAYFDSIPIEIEEAAKIDGASDFQILWKIVLLLARPAIIVTAVITLIFVWNEWIFATTFLVRNTTLAGGLFQLQSTEISRNWPLFSAGSIIISIPILIIFFKLQKYMIAGLTAGSVKG